MAARSALLSFRVGDFSSLENQVIQALHQLQLGCNQIKLLSKIDLFDGRMAVFGSHNSPLSVTMRIYKGERLVTLNLEENVSQNGLISVVNNVNMDRLRKLLAVSLSLECHTQVERIPVMKRATDVPNYYSSSDERVLEYDFDKILFDGQSQFQHVKILHSPSLGNCLILDDLQNLAEADINYTRGLMNYGKIDYKDKEILILGGGDGGLLHELLKEKPKQVTMVDIDSVVIEQCRIHLRGACGDSMDTLQGDNYQVLVGDCIKYMEESIPLNRTFDIVFNDLTDIPICAADAKAGEVMKSDDEEMWSFVKRIVSLGLQVLRPNGKYLNHAIGIGCVSSLNAYEQLLKSLSVRVDFSRHSAYVPSFMEEWVFYEIWKV